MTTVKVKEVYMVPTSALRFVRRTYPATGAVRLILQQEWTGIDKTADAAEMFVHEWRDVPQDGEDIG